ncbi:MAG: hypothetical protein ACOC44_05030 [Promethearchaeia archaeon]
MSDLWDYKADKVKKGDGLRDVSPEADKTWTDDEGITHYVFKKKMFHNPYYDIPDTDQDLFDKFLKGGSRSYPSDGNIPADIAAREARKIIKYIEQIAKDKDHQYYKEAREVIKGGKFDMVRGTMKLYLGKYTTRDWRRKRFTDDIDFWIHKVHLFRYVMRKLGWIRNKDTKEFEKKIRWKNPFTHVELTKTLIAANNLNLLLDFGGGSYLKGSSVQSIIAKKIKRGHNVDLSDIVNVAMVHNKAEKYCTDTWKKCWQSIDEAANSRSTRIISNLISLSLYSYAIAGYIQRVGDVLIDKHNLIFDKSRYPDPELEAFCRVSIHWQDYLKTHGPDLTRELIHEYIFEQGYLKKYYAKNLKDFADKIVNLVNEKLKMFKVMIEIDK